MRAERAAASACVKVKALRYYENHGLLKPARLPNGYLSDYGPTDVRLAGEIRELRSLRLVGERDSTFLDCLRDGHDESNDCPELSRLPEQDRSPRPARRPAGPRP